MRTARPGHFGGAEMFTLTLAQYLQQNTGLEVTIATNEPKFTQRLKAASGLRVMHAPWLRFQSWSGIRILLTPLYLAWIAVLTLYYLGTITRQRIDIVHLESKDDFIAGTLAARLLGKPVFWTDHMDLRYIFANHSVWYKNPVGKLVYWAAGFARKIVAVSETEKELILEQVHGSERIASRMEVIHNGVTDRYSENAPMKDRDTFTFGCTSRLVKNKGIGELIEAFGIITKQNPGRRLVLELVGDGPDRPLFEHQAQQIGDSIKFLGYQENVIAALSRFDVYTQPSYQEGFSISLLEAAMMKLPIIVSRVDGNKELIQEDVNGLMVAPGDATELASAMQKMLDDAPLRDRLSENARKTYQEHYSFTDVCGPAYAKMLNSL